MRSIAMAAGLLLWACGGDFDGKGPAANGGTGGASAGTGGGAEGGTDPGGGSAGTEATSGRGGLPGAGTGGEAGSGDQPGEAGAGGEPPMGSGGSAGTAGSGGSSGTTGSAGAGPEPECTTSEACSAAGFDGWQTCSVDGELGECELLLLDLVIPDDNQTGQYNYEVDGPAQLSFRAYDGAYHTFWTQNLENHATPVLAGEFDGDDVEALANPANEYVLRFVLQAETGYFDEAIETASVNLSAVTPTRWEASVVSNDWETVTEAPPVYSWDRGVVLLVYGKP